MSTEFVERILTVEDQQALSAKWYGDAHYSEHEVLDTEVIERDAKAVCKQCAGCLNFLFGACALEVEENELENSVCVSFFSKQSIPAVGDDFYSTSRNWTDYEMDVYL